MTVSIKFCGGCNPKIDRVAVAAEIKHGLLAKGIAVAYNNPDADFIVYVSGCQVSCAARFSSSAKVDAVIAGPGIDARAVDEDCLGAIVIEKVGDYLEKLARPL